ncbi:MAG: tyrosine-type recombinase/integrase [Gemmatimonadales bacterium]
MRGDRASVTQYERWLKRPRKVRKAPLYSIHSLRHTAGVALARAGWGAPDIMAMLGHQLMQTSQRYIHGAASPERLQQLPVGVGLAALGLAPPPNGPHG